MINWFGLTESQRWYAFKIMFSFWCSQYTEFVPDEYWQSTEVASVLHFGRGHLTWEWHQGLRSYGVPYLISCLYKIGSFFEWDSPRYLVGAPQMFQFFLTFYAVECFFGYVNKRLGIEVARVAEILLLANWFAVFCGARLLINQTEMSLNVIGLSLLTERKFKRLTALVGFSFMIRPTTAIFWLPFVPEILRAMVKNARQPRRGEQQSLLEKYRTVIDCALVGLLMVVLGSWFDLQMSGRLSWWEFFKFNFLEGGSGEFGVNPWWWYLFNALPCLMGPLFVLLPFGLFIKGETRRLSLYLTFYLVVYSFLAHKEIRFLLPALPLIIPVTASVLVTLRNAIRHARGDYILAWNFLITHSLRIFYMLNIGAVVVIGVYHQRGIRPAATAIYDNIKDMENPNVWILTPCYNVPVFTYMSHPTANFEYYVCAPKRYRELYTAGDQLFQPNGFDTVDLAGDIKRKLTTSGVPDFVLTFDKYVPTILGTLRDQKVDYFVCSTHFHTYFPIGQFPQEIKVLCNNPRLREKMPGKS